MFREDGAIKVVARALSKKETRKELSVNERSIQEQIVKYLADIHSIEVQALVQMKIAPKIAGDATLAGVFERHIGETEDQKRRVDQRLEALAFPLRR